MRRTSDEIEYQAHNLWLIDERLAYCEYVSSDIPFDNNPREDRTDVMILDKPVAVSDEPNTGREMIIRKRKIQLYKCWDMLTRLVLMK